MSIEVVVPATAKARRQEQAGPAGIIALNLMAFR
jgi:hypothetical protein